jgi:hypothetical protein
VLAKCEVVRHERCGARFLDTEMAAAAILEARLGDERGQHETERVRALGQVHERVELGDGLGRALQAREIASKQVEQLVVELLLTRQRALARR